MSRRRTLPAGLFALFVLLPAASGAQVGQERPPANVRTEAFGQIVPGSPLEFIGADPSYQLGYGVYDVSTGTRLTTLNAPLDDPTATRILVDFDGDGIDEVLGLYVTPQVDTEISLQAWSKGQMTNLFPDVQIPDHGVQFVGTMRLNSANPNAMVFAGNTGVFIVRQTGAVRYDSTTDPAFPDLGSGAISTFIADSDGDGFDELAVVYEPTIKDASYWSVLIGDQTPSLGVGDASLAARPLLQPSRPNPAAGPARIGFETPKAADVRLQIYDAAGRLVNRLANGPMGPGLHERLWDGRDLAGHRVPGGVYFYELVVDGVKETRKLVQLR